jgi:hypothetical protein
MRQPWAARPNKNFLIECDMAEETFHQTQHDLARTIIRTFYEALSTQLDKKHYLTKTDLDRSFRLFDGFWPSTLPVFKANCKTCIERHTGKVYHPDSRRKDFVTRFVFSHVILNIPERTSPVSGVKYPQVIVRGIQKNVTTLFHAKEYNTLNSTAQMIFASIGTDCDVEMWPLIRADDTMNFLADKIFIRLLMRFKQFNHQRQIFVRNITQNIDPKTYTFTDEDFCELFECLFSRFEDILRTEDGRVRIDVYYSDNTAETITRIFASFHQFKRETKHKADHGRVALQRRAALAATR